MKTIELGVIELGSKVIVTDPCYGLLATDLVKKVKKGKYICTAYETKDSWGNRIAALRVVHEDFVNKYYNIDYNNEKEFFATLHYKNDCVLCHFNMTKSEILAENLNFIKAGLAR